MSLNPTAVSEWACLTHYITQNPSIAPEYMIPSVNQNDASWTHIYANYLHPNKPVVIQGVGGDWPVRAWAQPQPHAGKTHTSYCSCLEEESFVDNIHVSSNAGPEHTEESPLKAFYAHTRARVHHAVTATAPDLAYIEEHFGSSEVSIVSCGEQEFNSQK